MILKLFSPSSFAAALLWRKNKKPIDFSNQCYFPKFCTFLQLLEHCEVVCCLPHTPFFTMHNKQLTRVYRGLSSEAV